jgi:carboxymethylenebutenolidase
MYTVNFPKSVSIAAILMCVLLLGGCGSDQGGVDSADDTAARDNLDAMSAEHANDTTEPSAGARKSAAGRVVSQMMPYTEYEDELVYGYFAAPADMFEPAPAVIMIHEWWGLNDNIRAMANRLAGEGYIVFAVDLFSGKIASSPQEARQLMLAVIEDPESANQNIMSAYEFVSQTAGAPRIGSLGWCFGGGWSLNAALLLPDQLDASVIYYGQVTADEDKLQPVNTPILGLFGAEDRGIKIESVRAFGAALEHLRKDYEIHIYPGVGHAFANPTGNNYDAASAGDAWRRTLDFFERTLVVDET